MPAALGLVSGGLIGAVAGALTGMIGSALPSEVRLIVGLLGAAALLGVAVAGRPRAVLQIDRETSQALMRFGHSAWATLNGALLGLGVTSRLAFWAWYLIPLCSFASASPAVGAVVWGTFGTARMATTVAGAVRMRRDRSRFTSLPEAWLGRKGSIARGLRVLSGISAAAVVVIMLLMTY